MAILLRLGGNFHAKKWQLWMRIRKHPVVYVVTKKNRIMIRPVTLGEDDGVHVQILSGLSTTDRVVTRGKHEVMAGDEVLPRAENP